MEHTEKPKSDLRVTGEYTSLTSRKIRQDTCEHWGYRNGEYNGKPAQFAYYYDDKRTPVACKVRFPNKDFIFIGEPSKAGLYGQHLWRDGGKSIIITEGEIDALSVSQVNNHKYPVVSLPTGAAGALGACKKQLEWLDRFESVVLMFDTDEPGIKAAHEVAQLFPGKAKIAHLPLKDANECLKEGKGGAIIDAFWGAKLVRPDGIVSGAEITRESLKAAAAPGYTLRLPKLNDMIGGIREREITLLTAGSGIGKSTLAREIAYGLHQDHNLVIGNIYLEEGIEKTAQGYVAIHNNVPLGALRKDPSLLTDTQWDQSLTEVIHQRMHFHKHFGSLDSDNLIAKIKFLRVALGCHFVVLDHISIVISGQESSTEGERKDIDRLMTKLRSLVEETGVGIIAIVHLNTPEGKPHEEGGRVTLKNLRGSGSLKQLSDNVIALERDQQGTEAHISKARVLKCREFGETGITDTLGYNKDTGRLLPVEDHVEF